jgi:hypothetical protein
VRFSGATSERFSGAGGGQEHHACEEPADVSEPRDASNFRASRRGAHGEIAEEQLHEDPKPDHDHGRDVYEPPEEREAHEREDARVGEQEEIRAEDAGHRAAGADHRDVRARGGQRLRDRRRDARQEIEDEESPVPQRILDVVAEDPQIEHVADDVHRVERVHEHRGEDRHQRAREIVQPGAGAGEPARHRAELEDERFRRSIPSDAEGHLVEVDQHVEHDEGDRHQRHGAAGDVVAQRDHCVAPAGRSTITVGRAR